MGQKWHVIPPKPFIFAKGSPIHFFMLTDRVPKKCVLENIEGALYFSVEFVLKMFFIQEHVVGGTLVLPTLVVSIKDT